MLQVKMRNLKEHADTLLDSILNHPNLTESQIYQMDNTQKEELRARVKAADDVSYSCTCWLHMHGRFQLICLITYHVLCVDLLHNHIDKLMI